MGNKINKVISGKVAGALPVTFSPTADCRKYLKGYLFTVVCKNDS
jgi:hypothetical protein